MDHLKDLNPKQKEAATHKNGPLLIVAGAGAGKTKTITHRILNLIKEGVEPSKILAVTFTNKAAKEMRERILSIIDKEGGQENIPFISTFHSLGVYIIKENARELGLNKYFSILDEGDTISMIKEIMKEKNIDPKQYDPRKIRNIISREKGKFIDEENYASESYSFFGQLVKEVWKEYEGKKKKENSLDFDDLLLKSVKLLKEDNQIRKSYQEKWKYVHIDEYQDTNEVQYLMSKLLVGEDKNICVVGDADQNIYSWRGANLKNILNFEKDYPETKIILLEENYRSTKVILEVANEIIKKNKYRPEKNLFTKNTEGEKVGFYEALDENDEADFIAIKILDIYDSKKENDVAVLYRANFQSRALEEAMLRYNIPYQVLGIKFFERKEVKDTLSYLRASLNRESLGDIKRIINFPTRGIGKVTLAKIFAGETESLPIKTKIKINKFYEILDEIKNKIQNEKPSEVIKFLIKRTGIENELLNGGDEDKERLENIKELATLALKYNNLKNGLGIEKLIEDASLSSDQDSIMINEEKNIKEKKFIKLMTVHASKGLEFDYVFIAGLEDGLFPHERSGDTLPEDMEEERRLFYVALTRARKKIFLTFANFRTIFGSRQINTPSEFISDIPKDLVEEEGTNKIKTIYI